MTNKTIFITGAGSGIGEATARMFHKKGWIVGVFDINETAVKQLENDLGDHCIAGHLDVTDAQSVKSAIGRFAEYTQNRLDVFCNNAGVFDDVLFGDQSHESIQKIIRVNIDGVVNCAKEAFPLLKATKGARLINLASGASVYGVPMEAVYSASKFFVRGLSESLELEWRHDDIGVAVIMPAYVNTPMVQNAEISWGDRFGVKLTAEDVANTIWKASLSKRLYWPTPFNVRLLMTLIRVTPLNSLTKIARVIFR